MLSRGTYKGSKTTATSEQRQIIFVRQTNSV